MKTVLLAGVAALSVLSASAVHSEQVHGAPPPEFTKLNNQAFSCIGIFTTRGQVTITFHPSEGKVYWRDEDGKSYWGLVYATNVGDRQTGQRIVTSFFWRGGSYAGPQDVRLSWDKKGGFYKCSKINGEGNIDFEHATQIVEKPMPEYKPSPYADCMFYAFAYKPSMQYGGSARYDMNAHNYCSSLYGN